MNNSKKPVSFADALLSADSQTDLVKPRIKSKINHTKSSRNPSSSNSNPVKRSDSVIKSSSSNNGGSGPSQSKSAVHKSEGTKHKNKSKNKIKLVECGETSKAASSSVLQASRTNDMQHRKSSNQNTHKDRSKYRSTSASKVESFTWCGSESSLHNSSSDSDHGSDKRAASNSPSKSSINLERPNFVSNRQAGSGTTNKIMLKLLEEDKERQQNTKMLQSVEDDLMLFDLQLEDNVEMETDNKEEEKVPVLPPGLPFLHSLTCHKLYSLDKVMWQFSTAGGKGGNNTAIISWLKSLNEQQQREVLLNRVLMESELGTTVVGPLFRYLIRYIAAFPHHCRASSPVSAHDDVSESEVVSAVYQLLCYHITTTTNPAALLAPCISEMPLALVNIGCDPTRFPPATLDRWKISASTYHCTKSPNSASDSISQMHAMQLLLSALSNCLARVASCSDSEQARGASLPDDETLDDLVTWLTRLGQDHKVLSCSLHISVSTAIAHALQLYQTNYHNKVQDLVERISLPWLDYGPLEAGDTSTADDGTVKGSRLSKFPHHTASYVCTTLLPDTDRGRMLAASLAFLSLIVCIEGENPEVLDYVEMSDVVAVIASRKDWLLQECDCYRLRSVLLFIDTCVTLASIRQPTQQKMCELREVSQFVRVELARLVGGGEGGQGSGNGLSSTRTKTQLTGLRTAILQRWEKIMHVGATVYTPDGRRALPSLGQQEMEF